MSFAVWNERPPFAFSKDDPEQIYQVVDKWIVTNDPARATQAEIDAVLAPPVRTQISDGHLAALLVSKKMITEAEIAAAIAASDAAA